MGKWIKSDFRKFLAACERHGRKAQAAICTDVALATGKTEQEVMEYQTTTILGYPLSSASPTVSPCLWQVREYFEVFWRRYKELGDWKKIIDKIERGERKIQVDLIETGFESVCAFVCFGNRLHFVRGLVLLLCFENFFYAVI